MDMTPKMAQTVRVYFFTALLVLTHHFSAAAQESPGTLSRTLKKSSEIAASHDSLFAIFAETGKISLSVDGLGTLDASGTIQVNKPAGATVRSAFLAAATTGGSGRRLADGEVALNGVPVAWDTTIANFIGSHNHWATVTSIIQPIVDSAPPGRVDITVTENATDTIDGEILAVVFDDPNQVRENSVALFFGAQDFSGRLLSLEIDETLDLTDPGLALEMGLGISFSFQNEGNMGQFGEVVVNDSLLTSFAGGQDDGDSTDGALLTVGGLDDCRCNPPDDTLAGPRMDDELYDLKGLVSNGTNTITTANPSEDDNIFFASFFSHFPPDQGETSTLSPLLASNLVGTPHTVTATVQDSNDVPLNCGEVIFEVVAGPSQATIKPRIVRIDLNGRAHFTYVSNAPGTDVIESRFVDSQGDTLRNRAVKHWFDPPHCSVEILAPVAGAQLCSDSVEVQIAVQTSGGIPPTTREVFINKRLVSVVADSSGNATNDTLQSMVFLEPGENSISASCRLTDVENNRAEAVDSLQVVRARPPLCEIAIDAPIDGSVVCGDSVTVSGSLTVTNGVPPFQITCEINGLLAEVSDLQFAATVPLDSGQNVIAVACTVVDSCGEQTVCSDSVTVVRQTGALACDVEIASPLDSTVIVGDSVRVLARTNVTGDNPPFSISCEMNGFLATALDPTTFTATLPLDSSETLVVVACTVVDDCGSRAVCRDSVRVFRQSPPSCDVEIISPRDTTICGDSVTVAARTRITGGMAIGCEINGVPAILADSLFTATIPVASGENFLVAVCTVVDSLGNQAACRDSARVFVDDIPPTCSYTAAGSVVTGTISDHESGIAGIEMISLINLILTVDDFQPGARSVDFRLDVIDPNKAIGFGFDVIDLCGNRFTCDPVLFTLSADQANRQASLTFPGIDRYFSLTNHGLSEVRVDLNGNKFNLFSDPVRVEKEMNSYLIPVEGTVTIDLQGYLRERENSLFIAYEGTAGTSADLVLIDSVDGVDYVLKIDTIPLEFHLFQNYPNPFNPSTRIRFDLPSGLADGALVRLRIYNPLGGLVRTLLEEMRFPGQHAVEWDGQNDEGEAVSSGIYVYQLQAGDFRAARRLLLLK